MDWLVFCGEMVGSCTEVTVKFIIIQQQESIQVMQQLNLTEKLLMEGKRQSQQVSPHALHYEPVETEGECILKSVTPLAYSQSRYTLFCIFSVLLLGIPIVFAYWYPKFKLWLYYSECSYETCTHFAVLNYDDQITIVEREEENYLYRGQKRKIVFFHNRYMKYVILPDSNPPTVRADIYDYDTAIKQIVNRNYIGKAEIRGREEPEVSELRREYGPGVMIIEKPTLGVLFFRQIVQPLYFFIIATLVIWLSQNYIYYCAVIFLTTAIGVAVNLYQTQALNKKIYDMAYYEVQVNVLRGDRVVRISSRDVVPSDIVFLKDPIKIPFDGVVLQGSGLVNESALTGESVPVVRKAEDLQTLAKQSNSRIPLRNNLICQGTTLIQVDNKKPMQLFQKHRLAYGIPIFVIRTNFVTLKGQLIRIISFPIEKTNIFQKQSALFLVFLFVLAVLSYSILIIRLGGLVRWTSLVQKFLDLITITVPPGLPVSMTFGIIHAIEKLKKKDIYCVSPNKVIMGGLVDFICFDKTGTLTEDFMDFKCVVPALGGSFQPAIHNPQSTQTQPKPSLRQILQSHAPLDHILTNMAANHTIVNIASTGENVGDPMEVKLFQFGEYRFNDQIADAGTGGTGGNGKVRLRDGEQLVFGFESQRGHYGVVVRRMDFDSELLRMSVIVRSTVKEGIEEYFLYLKGSPEAIIKIIKPATLPKNYEETLKEYASSGFRVLAIGHKRLTRDQILLQRTQIELDIDFDGFEIFQNRLKPQSKGAIMQLTKARIPCVMITGDNALTGCNMSYKSKIANFKKKLYIFNYKPQEQELACQEFRYEPDAGEIAENEDLHVEDSQDQKAIEIQMRELNKKDGRAEDVMDRERISGQRDSQVAATAIARILSKIGSKTELCLTGSTFAMLFGHIQLDHMDDSRKRILKATKVYARAKPNEKARIIMAYQQGLGKVVSMCGDGANDCGALKQSDAGLSLSQTQASISAPFTSKVTNVSSMVELIKQCRSGLVTNFSLFNIMAMYSLIQYTSAVLCQYMFAYPSDFSFLYWDIFGNFLFFIVFGYTGTADTLSEQKPSRSLFTLTNLVQVCCMYLTQLAGQVLMIFSISNFFANETDYWEIGGAENNLKGYRDNDNSFLTSTPETSVIFLFANFMYLFSFIAFSISKPWRKQFYTNIPFMIVFVLVFTYSTLLVVVPKSRISLFQIQGMTNNLINLYVLLAALVFSIIMYVNQKCILEPISARLRKSFPDKLWI